ISRPHDAAAREDGHVRVVWATKRAVRLRLVPVVVRQVDPVPLAEPPELAADGVADDVRPPPEAPLLGGVDMLLAGVDEGASQPLDDAAHRYGASVSVRADLDLPGRGERYQEQR